MSEDRLKMFSYMLETKKIQYYSYDTDISLLNSFGKAIVFNRWLDMMKFEHDMVNSIYDLHKTPTKDYYLLIDNDFIVGKQWDEYFISALDVIENYNKDCKFLVCWPGGIPGRAQNVPIQTIGNLFKEGETFGIRSTNAGGASGFWFFSYEMSRALRWEQVDLDRVYNISKRHDTCTWNMLRRKFGPIKYVTGIIPPVDKPVALHIGSQCGSLCNQLKKHTYDEAKLSIKEAELKFKDMSCDEIFEQYKTVANRW